MPPPAEAPPPAAEPPPPESEAELPPPASPDEVAAKPEKDLRWIARLSAGFGPVFPSAQEDALNTDGYGGGRWLGILDYASMLGPHWAIGGFLGGAIRSLHPDNAPANLTDHLVFVGPEAMFLAGAGKWRFPLVGRLGYAGGTESFHGAGRWQSAPVIGLEMGFLSVHFPIALDAGVLFAPTGAPGDQGRGDLRTITYPSCSVAPAGPR